MNRSSTERWLEIVALFNTGDYRRCVEPLEFFWCADHDDFSKALIRVCVGLMQLHRGLLTSPRGLLASAHALLMPFAPATNGLDIADLQRQLAACLALIPADHETGTGQMDPATIPAVRLRLAETAAQAEAAPRDRPADNSNSTEE